MKADKFAVLREQIQKGIADLEVGKVRSGKKVLGDLALRVAVRQGLAEIQRGKTMSLDGIKIFQY
jgi:hypothetical protein